MARDLDDITIFENFRSGWRNESLSKNDPVLLMVKRLSKAVRKIGGAEWVEDIENIVLINIYNCGYCGKGSLEGYIRTAVRNAVFTLFHNEHQNRRDEMPTEVKDKADFDKNIKEQESSDKIKMIISRTPKHLLWFVEAVLDADSYLSERKIAEICKVKRNQVVKAKKELQKILIALEKEQSDKSHTAKFK